MSQLDELVVIQYMAYIGKMGFGRGFSSEAGVLRGRHPLYILPSSSTSRKASSKFSNNLE